MDRTELVMRRRNVRAFIAADPVQLVIHRAQPAVKNPNTGGYVPQPSMPLDPQTARIVQNVRRFTAGIENAEAGDIPNSEYRLIGMHDMDLEDNDVFEWRDEWYKVLPHGIHKARTESTYAAIELRGPENRGS